MLSGYAWDTDQVRDDLKQYVIEHLDHQGRPGQGSSAIERSIWSSHQLYSRSRWPGA